MRRRGSTVRTFYHKVESREPTARDLLSQDARGLPPPRNDPDFLEGWRATSVFDTYEAVRAQADPAASALETWRVHRSVGDSRRRTVHIQGSRP